jgi:hypothetical protein
LGILNSRFWTIQDILLSVFKSFGILSLSVIGVSEFYYIRIMIVRILDGFHLTIYHQKSKQFYNDILGFWDFVFAYALDLSIFSIKLCVIYINIISIKRLDYSNFCWKNTAKLI